MLTFRCATTSLLRSVPLAFAMLALSILLSAASPRTARAQEIESDSCLGVWISFNCVTRTGPAADPFVRIVPPPADAAAQSRAKERERRWVERCKPVITQDRYGVGRYRYAKVGCGFDVLHE